MRALLLVSVAILVCLPFASASPIPTMSIKIDQSSLSANAANANQTVVFTGSVAVNKSAYLSATVTLKGIVDKGWEAAVAPASMTFTSTTPQSFTCSVVVPAATPGGTEAKLTVDGTIQSGILMNTATASAVIQVTGTLPPPANQTGNNTNTTKPTNGANQTVPTGLSTTAGPPGILGFSYEQWGWMAVGAVIAIAAVWGIVRVRRRRRASFEVETVETVEEA